MVLQVGTRGPTCWGSDWFMSDPVILAAIIALIGSVITGGMKLFGELAQINRAVNHRDPEQDTLVQMVEDTKQIAHETRRCSLDTRRLVVLHLNDPEAHQ